MKDEQNKNKTTTLLVTSSFECNFGYDKNRPAVGLEKRLSSYDHRGLGCGFQHPHGNYNHSELHLVRFRTVHCCANQTVGPMVLWLARHSDTQGTQEGGSGFRGQP